MINGGTAIVFAGQGAQYSGMGHELYNCSPAAREVFDTADAKRPGTALQCFEGSAQELMHTSNTQPCVFTVELAAAAALGEAGIAADAAAGFSLGETAALTFAGVFDRAAGFETVCRRGEFMQENARGKMYAILRLDSSDIDDICKSYSEIYPVNYNSPKQTVVAVLCADAETESFCAQIKEKGGMAVRLDVGGAFHCPAMHQAADKMRILLQGTELHAPRIPVYANRTARPYGSTHEEICETAAGQIENPVLWKSTIEHMVADGIRTFIEVGPGKTLSGLIEKTVRVIEGAPQIHIFNVCDGESLQKTIKAVTANER